MLNGRAWEICVNMAEVAGDLRVQRAWATGSDAASGVWDFGVQAAGGLQAGLLLARVCMGGYGQVELGIGELGPQVSVRTDAPLAACMASQYAGWKLARDDFFAMGSGPMRSAAGTEELFARIGHVETPDRVVGVLETGTLPDGEIVRYVAAETGVKESAVVLLVAPTRSLAGTLQIVARSVETTLHKMLELGFDLRKVTCGMGVAPLPPPAAEDVAAIGRTNDAILYGGEVTLWMHGEDQVLDERVAEIPSAASEDYGTPFVELFRRYNGDFYQIDPHLFAPAVVQIVNLDSGRTFRSGRKAPDLLRRSFGVTEC